MGATCNNPNDNRKKSNDKYSCTECYRSPELKDIDCKNQKIIIYCPIHGRKNVKMESYLEKMSKNINHNIKCSKCLSSYRGSKKKIGFCPEDKKFYCNEDFSKLENNKKKYLIPIEDIDNCLNHPKDEIIFCKTCNKMICSKIKDHPNESHEKHETLERKEYKPSEGDLFLLDFFQKLIGIILKTYENYPNNYFHCINVTKLANYLKNQNIFEDINSPNNTKFKDIEFFNKLYECNIKKDDEKINLREKKIGDFGFKLLCKLELNNLKKLILINNNISNIDDLKLLNCPQLKTLNLSYNNIRDIDVFNEVNFSLTELDLNYNRIENINIFENMEIPQLKELKILKLFNNNYNLDNNYIHNKIQEYITKKEGKFMVESKKDYSEDIKKIDSINKKYKMTISYFESEIDLSSIKDTKSILKELKHPNVQSLKVCNIKDFDKSKISDLPKLNYLIGNNNEEILYIKNQNQSDVKFKNNILNLTFVKDIGNSDITIKSQFTYTIFSSIKNKSIYLIYYQKEENITKLKYIRDNNINFSKVLKEFENGIKLYQIRYYIDVVNKTQREIIIGSTSNSTIFLWEFKEENLTEINKIENSHNKEISYISMISDKNYKENYIISCANKEKIKIWNEKKKLIREIERPNNTNIYFIDIYNHYEINEYFIIIGEEDNFISYYFDEKKSNPKFQEYKTGPTGENSSAIIYENDDNIINLISCNSKSQEIKIFLFETGDKQSEFSIGNDCLSLGLNLWNNQYLIIACTEKEENKYQNENCIKIVELDDEENYNVVMTKVDKNSGFLSIMKFIDKNLGECIISKGLDGCLKLWRC